MDHRTPSLAYLVKEKPRSNIDTTKLQGLGLKPGPWIKELKRPDIESLEIEGQRHSIEYLRKELLVETEGTSVAYLTDFLLDETATERLTEFLRPCQTIVCESQYRHADHLLAERNFHMTSVQAANLAKRVACNELILLHVSERYERPDWKALLTEAREIFANTRYPHHWTTEVQEYKPHT
jgi:ribonuclease Z